MLKRIDGGNPWKNIENAFKMAPPGAPRFRGGIKLLQKFVAEQLHAHGGHFAEFNRRAAIRIQVLPLGGQGVEGMASLVQDGFHVALHPHRVHENEWQPRFVQCRLIAAGRFSFSVGQIEEAQVLHRLKTFGQSGIQQIEDALCFSHHLFHPLERAQRRLIQWIDCQVPRAKSVQI